MKKLLGLLLLVAVFAIPQEHGAPAGEQAAQHTEAATAHGEGHEAGGNPNEIWWKWLNFAILAGFIGWLTVKYAGPYFRARTLAILEGIEEGKRAQAQADARVAEIEKKLENIGADVESLRANSRQEIAAEGARVKAETEAQLAKIQAHAEQEIASAAKTASQELKAHAAELAVRLAEEQLRARIGSSEQAGFVRGFVQDLESGIDGKGSRN